MANYFQHAADTIPNGADEVELDWETKKNFYAEYVVDMERMKESKYIISRSQFYNIWNIAFPWVKIRKFKTVGGKCSTCCNMFAYRGTTRGRDLKEKIGELFAIHRSSFMVARMAYYKTRYASLISIAYD